MGSSSYVLPSQPLSPPWKPVAKTVMGSSMAGVAHMKPSRAPSRRPSFSKTVSEIVEPSASSRRQSARLST